jgi:hypothetical protein
MLGSSHVGGGFSFQQTSQNTFLPFGANKG